MLILFILTAIAFLVLSFFIFRLFFEVYVHLQGPFYAPATSDRIKDILKISRLKPRDKVVDLGSGDGRVLIACAKKGVLCTGFEIDPILVWRSRKNITRAGMEKQIKIIPKSFWSADISKFDVIIVYGITHIMERLEKKLQKEAKKNARIISIYFQFPHLKKIDQRGDIHLYSMHPPIKA